MGPVRAGHGRFAVRRVQKVGPGLKHKLGSTTPFKLGQKTSVVWKYFKALPHKPGDIATAICSLCQTICRIPGGSTTGMRGHLKSKHKDMGILDTETTVHAAIARQNSSTASADVDSENSYSGGDDGDDDMSDSMDQPSEREIMNATGDWETSYDEPVKNMAFFCIMDMKPLSIVEGDGFRGMLSHFDQDFVLKSVNEPDKVKTVAECIDELYHIESKKLSEEFQGKHVTVTVETWKKSNTERYVLTTANCLNPSWRMESRFLGIKMLPEPLNMQCCEKESILMVVQETLNQFDITQDQVYSMVVYSPECGEMHVMEGICIVPCLHQVVNTCFENLKKAITDIFDKDVVADCIQTAKNYLQNYETLARNPYCLFMSILASRAQLGARGNHLIDQAYLSTLTKLLSPLNDIIEISRDMTNVSGYVPISTILPLMFALRDQLKAFDSSVENYNNNKPFVPVFVQVIMDSFGDSYNIDFESPDYSHNVIAMAAFLDPRYKGLKFVNESQRKSVHRDALLMLTQIRLPASKRAEIKYESQNGAGALFMSFIQKVYSEFDGLKFTVDAEVELKSYLDYPIPAITTDPLAWWRSHHKRFPSLSLAALKILGIPANGSRAEYVFSKQGLVCDAERSAIEPEHLEKLLFLNKTFAPSTAQSDVEED